MRTRRTRVVLAAGAALSLVLAGCGLKSGSPMVDDVVWLPAMIDGMPTGGRLGATVGARVHIDPVPIGEGVAL